MAKLRYYATKYSISYQGYTHYESVYINVGAYNKPEALFRSRTLAEQYFAKKYNDGNITVNFLSIFRLDHEPHRWNGMSAVMPIISKKPHRKTKI